MDENLLNGVSSLTNLGSTWTVIPTHKTRQWWNSEKPNFLEEVPLRPQKVGVWAAISRRRIIRTIFFDGTNMYHKINDTNFFKNLAGCKVSGNHTAIS
jgi:hypothetical protein